ncbi:MAG TPA: hypothetical protein VMT89_07955, partial [Candidatus Acidoferrales bacterium]|nr:hypothetical protein [Candidatus Acidoferrales bacterium]
MPNPPASPVSTDQDARLWTLLLVSSLAYFFSVNQADNDLWGHLFAGREIVAHGAIPRVDVYSYTVLGFPWFNHEWLTHVIFAEVYHFAGSAGLLLYKGAAALTAFGLTFAGVRRRSDNPWVWGGVGLLLIAVLARGFAIRPQVFTYAAVALLLDQLDRYQNGRRQHRWMLPLLFVLWANVHGGFVLGLAILAGFALWQVQFELLFAWVAVGAGRRTDWIKVALPMLISVLCVPAAALNPYGRGLFGYLWDELSRSHPITE